MLSWINELFEFEERIKINLSPIPMKLLPKTLIFWELLIINASDFESILNILSDNKSDSVLFILIIELLNVLFIKQLPYPSSIKIKLSLKVLFEIANFETLFNWTVELTNLIFDILELSEPSLNINITALFKLDL
jgi:hypothetical protein